MKALKSSAPPGAADIAKDAAKDTAFRATTYRVSTDAGVFDLRIDQRHAAFAAFLKNRGVSRWAIVTACNPGAQRHTPADNARRQQRLLAHAQAAGWALGRNLFLALNCADGGDWPDEPGLLLLGIDAARARALAHAFGQLACVYGEADGMPHLLWTAEQARAAPLPEPAWIGRFRIGCPEMP